MSVTESVQFVRDVLFVFMLGIVYVVGLTAQTTIGFALQKWRMLRQVEETGKLAQPNKQ